MQATRVWNLILVAVGVGQKASLCVSNPGMGGNTSSHHHFPMYTDSHSHRCWLTTHAHTTCLGEGIGKGKGKGGLKGRRVADGGGQGMEALQGERTWEAAGLG